MVKPYDRATEDLGNVVFLEHVNVRVPDQRLATTFYVTAMGLTRDPYLVTGVDNMWINVGRNQFHLPGGSPQVAPRPSGFVAPGPRRAPRSLGRGEGRPRGHRVCFAGARPIR